MCSSRSCSRSRSSSRDKSIRHKRRRSSKEKDKGRKCSKRGRSSSRSPGPRKRPVTRSRSPSPRTQLRLAAAPRGVDRRMLRGRSRFGRFGMRGVVLDGGGRMWDGSLPAGMDAPVWGARRSPSYSRQRSPPYVRVRTPPGGFEAAAGALPPWSAQESLGSVIIFGTGKMQGHPICFWQVMLQSAVGHIGNVHMYGMLRVTCWCIRCAKKVLLLLTTRERQSADLPRASIHPVTSRGY